MPEDEIRYTEVLSLVGAFVDDRKEHFPNVTAEQKERWARKVFDNLFDQLHDNDIFYDWAPEDVLEGEV